MIGELSIYDRRAKGLKIDEEIEVWKRIGEFRSSLYRTGRTSMVRPKHYYR